MTFHFPLSKIVVSTPPPLIWNPKIQRNYKVLFLSKLNSVLQKPLNEDRMMKRFSETQDVRKRQPMHRWKEFKSLLTFCLCVGDSFKKLLYSGLRQGQRGHVLLLQSKVQSFRWSREGRDLWKGFEAASQSFRADLRRIWVQLSAELVLELVLTGVTYLNQRFPSPWVRALLLLPQPPVFISDNTERFLFVAVIDSTRPAFCWCVRSQRPEIMSPQQGSVVVIT